jgi:hypothetical protein
MHVLLSNTVYPGSRYYRAEEPARAVAEADLGITVQVQRGVTTRMVQRPGDDRLTVGSVDAEGADVVVLQLPKTVEMLQCLRLLQGQGVAVVVEIDDSFSAVPFGHHGHRTLVDGGLDKIALTATREADLVTVSTPALLEEYARHGRGAVVPNAVPRRTAELPPAYERDVDIVTIGWTGSLATHPYDLQVMESGLQQALDRTRGSSRFVILGQALDAQQRLHLPEAPTEVPWVMDVDGYVRTVGELFDIGLAPLREDRFNTAKSWLKVLEYAARGVFAVRSTTADYERLGLGRRARVPRDWATFIAGAVRDPDRRREQAAADHQAILAGHLMEHTAERWADAWRRARDNRTRAMRKGA